MKYCKISVLSIKKMFFSIFWAVFFICAVNAGGDFIVLHSPSSVKFSGNEEVDQSLLKEIFSAALGFTVKHRGNWSGISIKDPFTLPEAIVGIAVEGVDTLNSPRGKRFSLNVDEIEETTWQALSGRLEERDDDNTLIRIYLGDGVDALGQSALGELKPTSIDQSSLRALSLKNDEDKKFLDEIQLLRAIAKKIPSTITADSKPDVYWLVVSGLHPVIEFHGKESASVMEALSLLNDAFSDLSKSFVNVYNDKVLITSFTNDVSQVRHVRSANLNRSYRDNTIVNSKKVPVKNLGKKYTENYPVIFNIILWFGVVFFFSLLAICVAIASMDPGRDSIIYRMTSNRMKKEN
ncbi:ATPase H(+)-transporting accessory protein 2 [Belonocnema kinseyi]|uniref:ATPase H(+)-transporting accessory protein 2 n=1 Tax=Belonocnema kinseyi TaxID=2817044 RepID=UPI00143D011E|nr:ATPase H(+)-transporting accessory protein 2 [Belonocnema kinseyi]